MNRKVTQWIAGFGLIQLLFATALTVVGFMVIGLYRNLDCKGIWAGMPMMVPAILSVVVMGTRHKLAALSGIVTGVIVLIFSAYHIAVVWKDVDFWEKYKTYAESNVDPKPCFDRGDQCLCDDLDDYMKSGYIVSRCDHFGMGYDLFWSMIALTIGGIVSTILNLVLTIWGCFTKPDYDELDIKGNTPPPEYETPKGTMKLPHPLGTSGEYNVSQQI